MILKYDVIVIGGGHAGCEAACASANMGAKTCLITMDMNKIAQMSCNPAIGGIAKGQIVREIDALGGQMGLVTDATSIQFRMLNVGKGPAVWSPRAQCDRGKFIWEWRRTIDETDNLDVWQDQADELLTEPISSSESGDIRAVGIKGALNDGQECAIGLPVIYRRADDKSIGRGRFGAYLIADVIIENACARFIAAPVTGYAAPYRLIADPHDFAVDAVLP